MHVAVELLRMLRDLHSGGWVWRGWVGQQAPRQG